MTNSIRLARETDAEQIREIYAPSITGSAISFEIEVPSVEEMAERVRHKLEQFPWLVAGEDDAVLGYVYAGRYGERAAYDWSVEVSVYVRASVHRRGVGRALYLRLFEILREQGFRNAFAVIALPNPASVGLHESVGFRHAGVFPQAGYKLDAWHDVGYWTLKLQEIGEAPGKPIPLPELPAVKNGTLSLAT